MATLTLRTRVTLDGVDDFIPEIKLEAVAGEPETKAGAMASAGDAPPLFKASSLIDALRADAERRYEHKASGKAFGPRIQLPRLAAELGGDLPQGYHVINGGPGVGKTAFTLQLATTCECPALYVTCEMSPLELMRRIISRVTGRYLNKLKTGELTGEEIEAEAVRAVATCPDLAILDGTARPARADHILSAAREIRGDSPHCLIVIDSLHSWAGGFEGQASEYETISAACKAAQGIASSLGCAVLAISERNRAASNEARLGGTPKEGGLTSGAGSRKIEYGAESVMSLDAKEGGDPNHRKVTLTLAKNRNGSPGATVEIEFEGRVQTFREAAR